MVVIGSQSILGQLPDALAALLVSAEADLFPLNRPELADLIDGSIGEGSRFHELYGYYAQGTESERPFCRTDGEIGSFLRLLHNVHALPALLQHFNHPVQMAMGPLPCRARSEP